MHLRLLALMPYTVHCDHEQLRAVRERIEARERAARLLALVPSQCRRDVLPFRRREMIPW